MQSLASVYKDGGAISGLAPRVRLLTYLKRRIRLHSLEYIDRCLKWDDHFNSVSSKLTAGNIPITIWKTFLIDNLQKNPQQKAVK